MTNCQVRRDPVLSSFIPLGRFFSKCNFRPSRIFTYEQSCVLQFSLHHKAIALSQGYRFYHVTCMGTPAMYFIKLAEYFIDCFLMRWRKNLEK